MPEVFRTFEELRCWQTCRALRLFISRRVVPRLPTDERYRLRAQILGSARSTTANIAEGHGRFHYLDNAKVCRNARGSCCEVLDHLITARDEDFIDDDLLSKGQGLVQAALVPLNGYIRYLSLASDRKHEHRTYSQQQVTNNQ